MSRLFKGILSIIIIMVVLIAVKSGIDTAYQILFPLRYRDYIEKYSEEYGLSEYLVMGVIKAESNYIHDAHSGVARGLMQITDDTAKWIAKKMDIEFSTEDIENPETNIRMGCYYLSYLINYYNNIDVALAAYNGGMGNVGKWLSNSEYSQDGKTLKYIPFEETRKYVEKVNKYEKIYTKIYGGYTIKT